MTTLSSPVEKPRNTHLGNPSAILRRFNRPGPSNETPGIAPQRKFCVPRGKTDEETH